MVKHFIFGFVDHVALLMSVADHKAYEAQIAPLGGMAQL